MKIHVVTHPNLLRKAATNDPEPHVIIDDGEDGEVDDNLDAKRIRGRKFSMQCQMEGVL